MKTTYARRHRRISTSKDIGMFKKDNLQEQPFFAAPSQAGFFKPNIAIQRKCASCEAEEKQVQRTTYEKGEENVMREPEKKEEEKVMRAADTKEEDKKLQREPEKKEEEKVMRAADTKEEDKKLQREPEKKEEEKVMRQPEEKKEEKNIARKSGDGQDAGANATGSYIKSLSNKGQTLPKDAQQFFGQRMGYDFADVKIHTGIQAEESAKNVHAKAYTTGNNMVFNEGQYNPASSEGKKLLAHELTHVMQQQGDGQDILRRVTDNSAKANNSSGAPLLPNYSKTGTENKRAYGCEGVEVHGHTDANYTDSFDRIIDKAKPSKACEACEPPDCIEVSGTFVSTFKANPTVSLPPVPGGLTDCESRAVAKFINTTLKPHEQQHVAAFNTYNGVKRTPFKFTGCKDDFDTFTQQKQADHDALNAARTADANAKSDTLDPFSPSIPCDCKNQ